MYWLFQLGGWAIITITQQISYLAQCERTVSPSRNLVDLIVLAAMSMIATHLLRVIYLYLRYKRFGWKRLCALVPLVCAYVATGLTSALYATAVLASEDGIKASQITSDTGIPEYVSLLLGVFLGLLCWSGLYYGALVYRQYHANALKLLQMDSALKEARLHALRAQVNPHFLFNSLNTVRALIPHELTVPRDAVTNLADFLRASLCSDDKATIPFSEELEMVENFLSMEKLRHESRLTIDMSISPDTLNWPIPPFLFQTVVENAIKYGVSPYEKGGTVGIEAAIRRERLEITVRNQGRIDTARASTGLGLRNARARLELLFGEAASLSLEQAGDDVVVARITLPRSKNTTEGVR